MEHLDRDVQPSILIVEPDNQVRTLLEGFFSRVGWTCQSWNGSTAAVPSRAGSPFDIVIADSLSLEWEGWGSLRSQQQKNPDAALVLLVNPEGSEDVVTAKEKVLCCIDKEAAPRSIQSTLVSLVEEYQRVKKEGRLSLRPRTPMEAQITIESFTSREIAEHTFPFPILEQLHGAGLLDTKEKLKLQLALEEALANSLEHGNLELLSVWKEEIDGKGCDKYSQIKQQRLETAEYGERVITIVSDFDCERLLIRITDEGKGFTPTVRTIAQGSDNDPAVFGRGIVLIERTVDEVNYSCGGRQISLMKKIVNTVKG